MRISTAMMLALCAAITVSTGCSKTEKAFAVDGAGFSELTPSRQTKAFMVNEDPAFARQMLAHNATCARMAGCAKAGAAR